MMSVTGWRTAGAGGRTHRSNRRRSAVVIIWCSPPMRLMPLLAQRTALGRRHLLPALIILQQVLALRRRQLLKTLVALQDLIALFRRQAPEAAVGLLQLHAPLRRQLPVFVHRLEYLMAFIRRQAAEFFEVALRGLALFGTHLLPSPVVLQHPLTLVGTEIVPHVAIT